MFGPYGYNGSSYFNLIETQSRHIVRCLRHARDSGATAIEVTREANDRYFAEMLSPPHPPGVLAVRLLDGELATTSTPTATCRCARSRPSRRCSHSRRFPLSDYRLTTADRAPAPV